MKTIQVKNFLEKKLFLQQMDGLMLQLLPKCLERKILRILQGQRLLKNT